MLEVVLMLFQGKRDDVFIISEFVFMLFKNLFPAYKKCAYKAPVILST